MTESESEHWHEDMDEIKEKLIELFLNVKVRSKDEINDFDEQCLEEEKEKLLDTTIKDLINYVKTSIEILMNLKVEDYLAIQKHEKETKKKKGELTLSQSSSRFSTEPPQDYEEVIQKFEGDIRKHIRIEQQMKLHSESLQQKIEDKDKEIDAIRDELK